MGCRQVIKKNILSFKITSVYTSTKYFILWMCIYFFLSGQIYAQEEFNSLTNGLAEDSIGISLQEIEVTILKDIPFYKGGSMTLQTENLLQGNRIMGEADPLNFLKRLSGITTTGSYGSGIHIDGFDSSQSIFRINNIPIFFPYRFGGLFSTFNSSYFQRVNFERGFHNASMPNRLGAKIDFYSSTDVSDKFNGSINVGMMSSSVSLQCPIVNNTLQFSFAGRISYVDQLYGSFFRGATTLNYHFADLNANLLWKIDNKNNIKAEIFYNNDELKYNDTHYAMETHLKWSNKMVSLIWSHSFKVEGNNRLYFSGLNNSLSLILPQFSIETPSNINVTGISGDFSQWIKDYSLKLGYGYELNLYKNSPHRVLTYGLESGSQKSINLGNSYEARLYGDINVTSIRNIKISTGLSLSYFNSTEDHYNSFNLDPRINISYLLTKGSLNLQLGRYSQELHQVGFSQIGLASDFWVTSSKNIPVQNSYNIELDYTGNLGYMFFSITGYYRRILSEPDYVGQVLNLLDKDYNALDYIHVFNGYNCGINLISRVSVRKLTGIMGIGYGIARRKDPEIKKWIRGKTESGITTNLDINYNFNAKWQCSAQFRLASGRPYTPIITTYLIAGNLIKEFGEPNSALFPITHQLDLSATWKSITKIKKISLKHLINLSIINVYGHKNVEIMTYVFDPQTGDIALKKVFSLYRFLPSLSYTLEF